MKILLRNIPEDGNSCILYNCKDCSLSGAPDCQEMADFLGKKKRESLKEQENTEELEGLKRQVEKLEERIGELERIHYTQPSQPLITQPYPWAPIAPSYPIITCSSVNHSDMGSFLSETRDD